ncbi:MAG TPA: glycosyltransferase [Nitrospirae bacterium]|nr:D-inositol 3-phosphate glycosyltransferase [bacterium BMS3Abin06]HDH12933.1 glycosyltransferase [Nitrospirota bacterium]HDL19858.1 glycosyltransferase [Nitrospirota bacterium]HDZ01655.1 glycosyltransferase [Nitrospirota bacterium]
MRIVLIGPTYPFRGGIAHYTTLLCRALRENHDVKFISFKRQYPDILFPGRSDRDSSRSPVKVNDVDYIIDSLNPLTWLAAVHAVKKYRPDKIVLPWWVAFWTPQFWTILTMVKRHLESEVVIICHNVVEHEAGFMKKMASKVVLSRADRLITHSRKETLRLKDLLGKNVNALTAFHPTYAGLSDKRYSKEEARERLGLSGSVLLFFGFVRDYKGLGVLLDAMPLVLKDKDVTLLIVGEFWKDKQEYLKKIEYSGISGKVRIVDEYVPNEEIGIYFAAADLVVQPYISASGSGISQIAYGFDRPVIATDVGSLPEVVEDGVNGRIVKPGDAGGLAEAILESLDPHTLSMFSLNAAKTKEKFSWRRMAEIVCGEAAGLL